MENKHVFGIRLFAQKTYTLIISGIVQVLYWAENISMQLTNTAVMSFRVMIAEHLGMVTEILLKFRELARVSTNINNKMTFNLLKLSELMQISTNITDKMQILINVTFTRAMYRVTSVLAQTFSFTASIIIATLLRLSLYDPETLGTLDPLTLGEMDSIIVT